MQIYFEPLLLFTELNEKKKYLLKGNAIMSHGYLTCKVFSECCLQNVIYPGKTIQDCVRSGTVFGLNVVYPFSSKI